LINQNQTHETRNERLQQDQKWKIR